MQLARFDLTCRVMMVLSSWALAAQPEPQDGGGRWVCTARNVKSECRCAAYFKAVSCIL